MSRAPNAPEGREEGSSGGGTGPIAVPLSGAVQQAIDRAAGAAMKRVEERMSKAENNWKEEASVLLQNVAKNRRYVESFVTKQGDYVAKLNGFADMFRMEIDAKIHKGLSGGGLANEVLGAEDLPADYYWRLARIEKQVGTHRYLKQNKEAQSVSARLSALEAAAGIMPNAESFIDNSEWNNFPSGPISSLRVFSREAPPGSGRQIGTPSSHARNAWEGSGNVSMVPSAPKPSSSSASARPHGYARPSTHGAEFPTLSPNGNGGQQSMPMPMSGVRAASERNASSAPHQMRSPAPEDVRFEGSDEQEQREYEHQQQQEEQHHQQQEQELQQNLLLHADGRPGSSAQYVSSTLHDMSALMKVERASKFELQNQLAELRFSLDEKKFSDEQLKRRVDDLVKVNREQRIKEVMLLEQREAAAASLLLAREEMDGIGERLRQAQSESTAEAIDAHPAMVSLKQQVHEMKHKLKNSHHHNKEYEVSIKELLEFTKEVEERRVAAVEERNDMEALLLASKAKLALVLAGGEGEEDDEEEDNGDDGEGEEKEQEQVKPSPAPAPAPVSAPVAAPVSAKPVSPAPAPTPAPTPAAKPIAKPASPEAPPLEFEISVSLDAEADADYRDQHKRVAEAHKQEERKEERKEEKVPERVASPSLQSPDPKPQPEKASPTMATAPSPTKQGAAEAAGESTSGPAPSAAAPVPASAPAPASSSAPAQTPGQTLAAGDSEANASRASTAPPSQKRESTPVQSPAQSPVASPNKPPQISSLPSDIFLPDDIPTLRSELLKEEAFLHQVHTLRTKVKEDISTWLANFKTKNGREAVAADKEAIAPKYKAFKEVILICYFIINNKYVSNPAYFIFRLNRISNNDKCVYALRPRS
jgi:hypothetical protein